MALAPAFAVGPSVTAPRAALQMEKAARGQMPSGHGSAGAGAALAVAGLAAAAGVRKSMRGRRSTKASVMVGNTNVAEPESYHRDHLVACRAQLNGVDAPTP
ncbi:unnamed protein product, partial [Durusdinium trenchii]